MRAMRLRSPTCKDQKHGKRGDAAAGVRTRFEDTTPSCRVNKTMPRADCPLRGIRSLRAYRRGHCPGRSSNADRTDCTHPALLPASARSPRGGAAWRPSARASEMPARRARGRAVEGDVDRALALGFGEKIPEARFRYLMLQCDICSEHGGRCLPWGNPHLLAKVSGARSRASRSAHAPRCETTDRWSLPLRRAGPDWDSSVGSSHALGCPPTHPALPRRPPGQGDRLRRANKNPGPPRGPGRADRAA